MNKNYINGIKKQIINTLNIIILREAFSMNNRDITCVNQCLFGNCSNLKEFCAFVLHDINNNSNSNKIIKCKLYFYLVILTIAKIN